MGIDYKCAVEVLRNGAWTPLPKEEQEEFQFGRAIGRLIDAIDVDRGEGDASLLCEIGAVDITDEQLLLLRNAARNGAYVIPLPAMLRYLDRKAYEEDTYTIGHNLESWAPGAIARLRALGSPENVRVLATPDY